MKRWSWSVSNRIRAALTTTVLTTAATGFMAGCGVGGDEEEEQVAYCTDENGEIVDEDYCDGYNGPGAGFFFLYLGGFGRGLPVGTVLPAVAPGSARPTPPHGNAPACPPAARSARDAGERWHRQRRRQPRGNRRRAAEL